MYYKIKEYQIEETKDKIIDTNTDMVAVLTTKEFEQEEELMKELEIHQVQNYIRFSKLEVHPNCIFGTFYIPQKSNNQKSNRLQYEEESNSLYYSYRGNEESMEKNQKHTSIYNNQKHLSFQFYIKNRNIIFVDDTNTVLPLINKINTMVIRKKYTIERFFYEFLESLISEDLIYLEKLEEQLSDIEYEVLNGSLENFNHKIIALKKKMLRFYRYYSELVEIGQAIMENVNDFFREEEIPVFKLFINRVSRLQSETQLLREYAMQVQDVYQAQIDIRQNSVMKVLTIVTTIFLPLSLIAGWYGMNFKYMPELQWKYGYALIAVISIAVVAFCLWIFKRKKFW